MELYKEISKKQRENLKEADIFIIENKDYNEDETNLIFNTLTTHIFSKSKNDIPNELGKFRRVLQLIEK